MSQENVEIIRRAYDSVNQGDPDGAVVDVAPECEYVPSGAVPGFDSVYRGPEGYKQFMAWLTDQFDDARTEAHELIDAGEHVVAAITVRGRGRQSQAVVSWEVWQVWTLRGGRIVHGQGFTSRNEALEAAGLSE